MVEKTWFFDRYLVPTFFSQHVNHLLCLLFTYLRVYKKFFNSLFKVFRRECFANRFQLSTTQCIILRRTFSFMPRKIQSNRTVLRHSQHFPCGATRRMSVAVPQILWIRKNNGPLVASVDSPCCANNYSAYRKISVSVTKGLLKFIRNVLA